MADRSVVVRLSAQVTGYMSSMAAAAKVTKDFGASSIDAAAKHRESWDKVGKTALVAGGLVAVGVGEAIRAAAEFDAQMSVVKANVDDKTAPSMQRLADAALHAGRTTMFSASQAAEAENELAKAGVSAADIVGGALTSALSLASAGQLDLGAAAEYVASTMVQFNLHAKDTGHIADVLAAAADKSLGGVSDIAEALKYAGVNASQFHVSLDETVGVLAEFASNGLLGSMAGTGLREMLVRIVKPTTDAKAAMKDLGLEFFDSNGKFMGLANMAGQLHDKLARLTDQQRQQTLVTLFGQRAMAEGNILFRDGASGVQKWTNAVNDQGFAAMQASTKMDNLNGDLTKLKNTLNATFIEAGQNGQGPLRSLVQDTTGLVRTFGSLPKPLEEGALGLGVVAAGALLLSGAVVMTTTRVAALKASLATMGVEGNSASSALKGIGAAAAGVAIAVPILHDLSVALTGDKALGNNVAADQILSNTGAIGEGFRKLGDTLHYALGQSALDQLRRVGDSWTIIPDDATRSVHWLQSMDAGLSQLAQSGYADQAAAAFKRITEEAKRQGISIATVTDAMPQYSAVVTHVTQASKDASVAAAKQSEALVSLGQDANATGSAMALMGQGADAANDDVKNLAKSIQTDMDNASKAFMKDMDVLGTYDPAKTGAAVQSATDSLNSALESLQSTKDQIGAKGQLTVAQQQQLGKAEVAVHDSVGKSAKARAKAEQNLSDLQARLAAKGKVTVSEQHSLDTGSDAVAKAQKALDAAKAANGGLESNYAAAIAKGKKFTRDIAEVMRRGLDPQVVSKLLQEGPTQAAPVLQALLGKNSATMIKMVDTSEAQIRSLNTVVVEQARLTAMAVNSTNDQMTQDVDTAMGIAQAKATLGSKATIEAIATQMHIGVGEVERIAKEFGIGLSHIPPPPPIPMTVDTAAGLANIRDFRQQLANVNGLTAVATIQTRFADAKAAQVDKATQQAPATWNLNPSTPWGKKPGQNASGTNNWRGGLTWINEQGAELIDLPAGSKVYPHQTSMAMLQQILSTSRGGASSHTETNNYPVNIEHLHGVSLDDAQRQAQQRNRLTGLGRTRTRR